MSDDKTPEGGAGDAGQEFKPIQSQDELNRIIGQRVERERARFADYDEVKTKAAEFDKVAEASKTELQKANDRAEAAEKRAALFEAKEQRAAWAAEITKDSAVPAHLLRGETREALEEHFTQLADAIKAPATTPPPRRSTPPGKSPEKPGGNGDRAAAAVRALRGQQ